MTDQFTDHTGPYPHRLNKLYAQVRQLRALEDLVYDRRLKLMTKMLKLAQIENDQDTTERVLDMMRRDQ